MSYPGFALPVYIRMLCCIAVWVLGDGIFYDQSVFFFGVFGLVWSLVALGGRALARGLATLWPGSPPRVIREWEPD